MINYGETIRWIKRRRRECSITAGGRKEDDDDYVWEVRGGGPGGRLPCDYTNRPKTAGPFLCAPTVGAQKPRPSCPLGDFTRRGFRDAGPPSQHWEGR
jgi:hypothetical protein